MNVSLKHGPETILGDLAKRDLIPPRVLVGEPNRCRTPRWTQLRPLGLVEPSCPRILEHQSGGHGGAGGGWSGTGVYSRGTQASGTCRMGHQSSQNDRKVTNLTKSAKSAKSCKKLSRNRRFPLPTLSGLSQVDQKQSKVSKTDLFQPASLPLDLASCHRIHQNPQNQQKYKVTNLQKGIQQLNWRVLTPSGTVNLGSRVPREPETQSGAYSPTINGIGVRKQGPIHCFEKQYQE